MADTYMQAPKGMRSATILGHQYEIPANGKTKIVNPDHLGELRRHGFEDCDAESVEELEVKIANTDDKNWLVEFIEEHGGDADTSMSTKKLRRLATEALAEAE